MIVTVNNKTSKADIEVDDIDMLKLQILSVFDDLSNDDFIVVDFAGREIVDIEDLYEKACLWIIPNTLNLIENYCSLNLDSKEGVIQPHFK